jgi:hypothetical protein
MRVSIHSPATFLVLLCGCAVSRSPDTPTTTVEVPSGQSSIHSLSMSIGGGVEWARLVDPLSRVGSDPAMAESSIPEFSYYIEQSTVLDEEPSSESLRLIVPDPVAGEYLLEIKRSTDPDSGMTLSCQANTTATACADGRLLSADVEALVTVRFDLQPKSEDECSLRILETR